MQNLDIHTVQLPKRKINYVKVLGFFLLWPFGLLIKSMHNFRAPDAKIAFWLFCVFFGFTFVISDNPDEGPDAVRYAQQLVSMHGQAVTFDNMIGSLYNPIIGFTDIYQPILTWLVSVFTDQPKYLFALFAAIFGFFYSQNLWMIFDRVKIRVGLLIFLFMLTYALINPIWKINGVRMWTAAQIFLYGVLRYFLYGDKKGLAWVASTFLVHFSFLFPTALLFMFIWLPKQMAVFFGFFIFTSFIGELNLLVLRENLSFLPDIFQPKVHTYTTDIAMLKRAEKNPAWHVQFAEVSLRWVTYAWVVAIFLWRRRLLGNMPKFQTLFSFALFIGGWTQLAALVPSGTRFMVVSNSIFYAIILMALAQRNFGNRIRWLMKASIPFLLFIIVFAIRTGFSYMGFLTIFGNPTLAFIIDEQTPLIEFVKSIFR